MNQPAIVNLERFLICAESPEEEKAIAEMFFQLTYEKLLLLQPEAPLETWDYVSHYLKGSAAHLGMEAFSAVCRTYELAPPTSTAERAEALKSMHKALDDVRLFFAQRHPTSP